MDSQQLTGNWRAKAYNMHEQQPMNPYHGIKLQPEQPPSEGSEELINPFGSESVGPQGGIRPEDVPTGNVFERMEEMGFSINISQIYERMLEAIREMSNEELPPPQPYEDAIANVLEEAFQLFLRKNAEYGNSIVRTGTIGSVVALTGDIARLRVMVLHSGGLVTKNQYANIRDKLIDVLVQAAIGIMMLDEDNLVGKD